MLPMNKRSGRTRFASLTEGLGHFSGRHFRDMLATDRIPKMFDLFVPDLVSTGIDLRASSELTTWQADSE